jgi:hypothetical protein
MVVHAIFGKVLNSPITRTYSAYSHILSAGPILKARDLTDITNIIKSDEPWTTWMTVGVVLLAVLGVLRLVARVSIGRASSVGRVRQILGQSLGQRAQCADEELVCIREPYGTMYEMDGMDDDLEVEEMKEDVLGCDFA